MAPRRGRYRALVGPRPLKNRVGDQPDPPNPYAAQREPTRRTVMGQVEAPVATRRSHGTLDDSPATVVPSN